MFCVCPQELTHQWENEMKSFYEKRESAIQITLSIILFIVAPYYSKNYEDAANMIKQGLINFFQYLPLLWPIFYVSFIFFQKMHRFRNDYENIRKKIDEIEQRVHSGFLGQSTQIQNLHGRINEVYDVLREMKK